MAETMQRTSVLSIGALFQVQSAVISAGENISLVPRSSADIVILYLKTDGNSQP